MRDNADGDAKDGGRGGCDDKDDIDFEDDEGVEGEFLQSIFVSISTISDANLSFPGSILCKQSLKYKQCVERLVFINPVAILL